MKVRLLDLKRQYRQVGSEVEAATRRVLESGHYVLGDEVKLLEQEIAAYMKVAHAVGVSSGSDALYVALQALGIGADDEVITTAFSFFATAGAIARLGARPVFADIEPQSFNLDPRDAIRRMTPRTKAVIPVHLFGRCAALEPLRAAGMPIVEDAAQALGAALVGKLGRMATLSFFPSKNLGAAGDAGMVVTDDSVLADSVRLLRTHGARPKYLHHVVGGNYRIDALQAAILRAKLPFLDQWNARRRAHAVAYHGLLRDTPLGLPTDRPSDVWHHFVVRAPNRDALRHHLAAHEIETEVYYPVPLHLQPCFRHLGGREGDLPEAEKAAQEVLALPVHAELEPAELEYVAESIRSFYR